MHLSFITLWLSLAVAVLGGPPRRAVPSWAPPLSTRGRYVVDADGNRFKLKSGRVQNQSSFPVHLCRIPQVTGMAEVVPIPAPAT